MFFDVLDDQALAGKPVLLAATGGTERHSLVLDFALRPLFAYLKALPVPTGVYAASTTGARTPPASAPGSPKPRPNWWPPSTTKPLPRPTRTRTPPRSRTY